MSYLLIYFERLCILSQVIRPVTLSIIINLIRLNLLSCDLYLCPVSLFLFFSFPCLALFWVKRFFFRI